MPDLLRRSLNCLREPLIFDPFLSEEAFGRAAESVSKSLFYFGAISTDPSLPIFAASISSSSEPVRMALETVCQRAETTFSLVSSHINLQTHGLDGAFHSDDVSSGAPVTHALNWYVNQCDWPIEFGGYLLLGGDPTNLRAILPARNLAVLIPAELRHCAMSPSLAAGATARISLTLKLAHPDAI